MKMAANDDDDDARYAQSHIALLKGKGGWGESPVALYICGSSKVYLRIAGERR